MLSGLQQKLTDTAGAWGRDKPSVRDIYTAMQKQGATRCKQEVRVRHLSVLPAHRLHKRQPVHSVLPPSGAGWLLW